MKLMCIEMDPPVASQIIIVVFIFVATYIYSSYIRGY